MSAAKLEQIVGEAVLVAETGQLPQYIPSLAAANPRSLAVQVLTLTGESYSVGDMELSFSLMSISKSFVLLYLLSILGKEAVFARVGMEPSLENFNSLAQLEADGGWPRNPMINSGAIALASLLPGDTPFSRCQNFCDWLNSYGNCQFFLDRQMLASVEALPNEINLAIASTLCSTGHLQEDGAVALDTYNHVCCLTGNMLDLARLGMLLLQSPILPEYASIVKAVMLTCGLYQASGRFAVEVGVCTKSGVSGGVLSVIPGEGAIACYSPPLDSEGNSVAGLFIIKQLAQQFNLSIFS